MLYEGEGKKSNLWSTCLKDNWRPRLRRARQDESVQLWATLIYSQPSGPLLYSRYSDRGFFSLYRNFFIVFWLKNLKKIQEKFWRPKKHFNQNREQKKIGEQKNFNFFCIIKKIFIRKSKEFKKICWKFFEKKSGSGAASAGASAAPPAGPSARLAWI